jgi:hypothetical protein
MRRLLGPLFVLLLLPACEPMGEPAVPAAENRPCKTDDDCEIPKAPSSVREDGCRSRTMVVGKDPAMDTAVCGSIPQMATPDSPEPQILCFRGTCVPVRTQR